MAQATFVSSSLDLSSARIRGERPSPACICARHRLHQAAVYMGWVDGTPHDLRCVTPKAGAEDPHWESAHYANAALTVRAAGTTACRAHGEEK